MHQLVLLVFITFSHTKGLSLRVCMLTSDLIHHEKLSVMTGSSDGSKGQPAPSMAGSKLGVQSAKLTPTVPRLPYQWKAFHCQATRQLFPNTTLCSPAQTGRQWLSYCSTFIFLYTMTCCWGLMFSLNSRKPKFVIS